MRKLVVLLVGLLFFPVVFGAYDFYDFTAYVGSIHDRLEIGSGVLTTNFTDGLGWISDNMTALNFCLIGGSCSSLWDLNSSDDFSGDWSSLVGVPAGFSDGVDNNTQLSEAEVDAFVDNNGYLVNGSSANLSSLTGFGGVNQLLFNDGSSITSSSYLSFSPVTKVLSYYANSDDNSLLLLPINVGGNLNSPYWAMRTFWGGGTPKDVNFHASRLASNLYSFEVSDTNGVNMFVCWSNGNCSVTDYLAASGFSLGGVIISSWSDVNQTDTTCDGQSCNVANTGTLDGYDAIDFFDDTDSVWSLTGDYLFNNSGSLDFNETLLNFTIDSRNNDLWVNQSGIAYYGGDVNVSGSFYMNGGCISYNGTHWNFSSTC